MFLISVLSCAKIVYKSDDKYLNQLPDSILSIPGEMSEMKYIRSITKHVGVILGWNCNIDMKHMIAIVNLQDNVE